ncbi:MAG: hypothetical protein AVDCRST_MAG85-1241 [uncultured Solirubrobacteraceae bacterium]|uniref:Uncharacterized protein n=1 Tax=uncultured Solirubrobacteraceae bacterium TaxID=1162706 RepID=A0A6J4S7Y9_9ACTN|nr:MAG: hypothetical protein AVDCRST_MAG85-1241 [uncultured Solirubrobacteraceae bacterium]
MSSANARRRLPGPVLAALALALPAAGCGGDGDAPSATRPKAERPTAAVVAAARDPQSSVSVVKRYWRFVQDGALPGAISLYAPGVVRTIGAGTFAGMLSQQQQTIATARLNPLYVEAVADGVIVGVESLPPAGAKAKFSYYLRRGPDREWRIIYDTFSAAALQSFVQARVQRSVDPDAKTPSSKAAAAADDIVDRYRTAALEGIGRRSTERARRARGSDDDQAGESRDAPADELGEVPADEPRGTQPDE